MQLHMGVWGLPQKRGVQCNLDWLIGWQSDYEFNGDHIAEAHLATLPPEEFRNYGGICFKFTDITHEGVYAQWNIFEQQQVKCEYVWEFKEWPYPTKLCYSSKESTYAAVVERFQ